MDLKIAALESFRLLPLGTPLSEFHLNLLVGLRSVGVQNFGRQEAKMSDAY